MLAFKKHVFLIGDDGSLETISVIYSCRPSTLSIRLIYLYRGACLRSSKKKKKQDRIMWLDLYRFFFSLSLSFRFCRANNVVAEAIVEMM